MSKTVVYSCVTGNYDQVLKSILASTAQAEDDTSYVLFTDQAVKGQPFVPTSGHPPWLIKPLAWKHPLCRRRTARWHKVNSHVLFPETENVVWFDGSQRVKSIAVHSELVVPGLDKHDIATFKHPERICVFQELQACKKLKKDNDLLMESQVAMYRKDGYPPFNGMVETACLLRRHSPDVVRFNKLWWEQIRQHSYRDQLSFNYVLWKLNLEYARIPGSRIKSQYCDFVTHGGH
jgi:hypothetical protein